MTSVALPVVTPPSSTRHVHGGSSIGTSSVTTTPPPPKAAVRDAAWGASWDELDKPRYFSASICGSLLIRSIVYPITLVKTRIQHAELTQPANAATKAKLSIRSELRRISAAEGVARLYRGFPLNAGLGIVGGPIFLSTVERSRKYHVEVTGLSPTTASMVAGMTGSCVSQLLMVPADNIVQRMMVNAKPGEEGVHHTSSFQQARHIVKDRGIVGLYRGIHLSFMTYTPQAMVFWALYSRSRMAFHDSWLGQNAPLLCAPLCSGISGSCAMAFTTPFDTIKTRLQLATKSTSTGKLPGAMETATALVRAEGPMGLLRGLRMRVTNGWIMYPMFMSSYEFVKWFATIERPTHQQQQPHVVQ